MGEGKYAKATPILDRAGVPLAHHPEELRQFNVLPKAKQSGNDAIQLRVASFGSWPALVDWDADGDTDMLIGSFSGELYVRTNVSARDGGLPPEWAAEAVRIDVDGAPLSVNNHAAPAAADWDGDGLFDLVVGVADGSVVWFKNTGERGKPRFGKAESLVAPRSADKFVEYFVAPDELPPPGVRAQIAVVDYDLDGKLDLLVGDYAQVTPLRELSAAERTEFDALVTQRAAVAERVRTAKDAAARKAATPDYEAIAAKLQPFFAPKTSERQLRSWVWLYRRID